MTRTGCSDYAWGFCIALFSQLCWADSSFDLREFSVQATLGTTLVPPLLTTMGSGYVSDTRPFEGMFVFKKYAYAREDAAAFIASASNIDGVQLERAWRAYLTSAPAPWLERKAFAAGVLAWSTAE
ncbi:DUF2388 domain-containing protein [Pseudomonas aeruginosa]|uniref:DUF2388 domain-containing protein n=1 Tax=Pseudomonas aeruginosa TaxID=287 RepID=UPI0003BB06CA|nr:DUF2388 domain-containing protein [Pseudomonas aeruginosa]HCL2784117.1 DUF2388 domain-containing protein [Pseudomonas aeruginosa AC9A]EKQ5879598.1 DUF2388 domain-containing protein [Pseudomonas aeruginosa]EKW2601262.1 DUF2388 domain-containing protein [Pseudomonas aeruginosa]EKY0300236.1 DUF2388 domain-containing protein [Pseudomonas aeruginosa]EKY0504598.1 DUF2388 domain-containing protein [Pseudomonas aeruginosa]